VKKRKQEEAGSSIAIDRINIHYSEILSFSSVVYHWSEDRIYFQEKLFTNSASLELPPVVLPYGGEDHQQRQAVDMETLARYVLASAEFQQLLAAQVQKETQAAQKDTAQLQSAYLQQKHHYMNVKV